MRVGRSASVGCGASRSEESVRSMPTSRRISVSAPRPICSMVCSTSRVEPSPWPSTRRSAPGLDDHHRHAVRDRVVQFPGDPGALLDDRLAGGDVPLAFGQPGPAVAVADDTADEQHHDHGAEREPDRRAAPVGRVGVPAHRRAGRSARRRSRPPRKCQREDQTARPYSEQNQAIVHPPAARLCQVRKSSAMRPWAVIPAVAGYRWRNPTVAQVATANRAPRACWRTGPGPSEICSSDATARTAATIQSRCRLSLSRRCMPSR